MRLFSKVFKRKEKTITVPKVPDYVKLNAIYEPLEKFTRTELSALAKEWKKELLNKAKSRKDLK